MIRILQIIGSLERGGAETFLINLYKHIDRNKVQFDFAIYHEPSENSYYQEVIEMGGRVFILPHKSNGMLTNFRAVQKLIRDNDYKMVWRYAGSCFEAIDLLTAKLAGASETVLNSRCSHTDGMQVLIHYIMKPFSPIFAKKLAEKFAGASETALNSGYSHTDGMRMLIHYIVKPFLPLFVTKNFACGIMAGKWMFGRRPFEVINNGIEVEKFRYDEEVRNQNRKKFGLQDKIVVGHVGRFHPVKNHKLIIDVYEKFRQEVPRSALVLVGTGELLAQIQELVKEKELENDVLFLGSRSDVPEMLQMMDIFIMPSLFEGFPRAFLEAQAAGLPCVASSTISREVDVTGNVCFVDLDAPVAVWAERIVEKCGSKTEDNTEKLKAAGYDIKDVAKRVEAYMLEMIES